MLAALQSQTWAPVIFVEADCVSGPARFWSGIGSKTWSGYTWTGVGSLLSIDFPQETGEVQADSFSIGLSGIDPAQIDLALNECRQGNTVNFWLGAIADDGTILPDPILAAAGRMDVPTIEDGAATSAVKLSCESLLIDLKVPRIRRYTHEDQQLENPNDNGFIFVASIQDWNRKWLWLLLALLPPYLIEICKLSV